MTFAKPMGPYFALDTQEAYSACGLEETCGLWSQSAALTSQYAIFDFADKMHVVKHGSLAHSHDQRRSCFLSLRHRSLIAKATPICWTASSEYILYVDGNGDLCAVHIPSVFSASTNDRETVGIEEFVCFRTRLSADTAEKSLPYLFGYRNLTIYEPPCTLGNGSEKVVMISLSEIDAEGSHEAILMRQVQLSLSPKKPAMEPPKVISKPAVFELLPVQSSGQLPRFSFRFSFHNTHPSWPLLLGRSIDKPYLDDAFFLLIPDRDRKLVKVDISQCFKNSDYIGYGKVELAFNEFNNKVAVCNSEKRTVEIFSSPALD